MMLAVLLLSGGVFAEQLVHGGYPEVMSDVKGKRPFYFCSASRRFRFCTVTTSSEYADVDDATSNERGRIVLLAI